MAKVLNLSEAGSIAIHSMVLLAQSENGMNAIKIAERTGSSKNHIAKVLQRLVKHGLLNSVRGPAGGFSMRKSPDKTTLLEIYEAIEGKIELGDCPLINPVCPFNKCIMGTVMSDMTRDFRKYMEEQTLGNYI